MVIVPSNNEPDSDREFHNINQLQANVPLCVDPCSYSPGNTTEEWKELKENGTLA